MLRQAKLDGLHLGDGRKHERVPADTAKVQVVDEKGPKHIPNTCVSYQFEKNTNLTSFLAGHPPDI